MSRYYQNNNMIFNNPQDSQDTDDVLNKGGKATKEQVDDAMNKASQAEQIVRRIPVLRRQLDKFLWMLRLIRDYWNGHYTQVPWAVIGAIAGMILYVVFPQDAIPDYVPFIGYIDDASVVALVYKAIEYEVERYREWLSQQPHS